MLFSLPLANHQNAVPKGKKLTFMYLANDVIQNSKKKGPEYGKEFVKVLLKAFQHIGEHCMGDEKTLGSLSRILKIWDERGVYDGELVQEFRDALNREVKSTDVAATNVASDKTNDVAPVASEKRKSDKKDEKESSKRHKSSSTAVATAAAAAALAAANLAKEKVHSETIEVNGMVETHVILSQHTPAGTIDII